MNYEEFINKQQELRLQVRAIIEVYDNNLLNDYRAEIDFSKECAFYSTPDDFGDEA